jgi:hypothetical protein
MEEARLRCLIPFLLSNNDKYFKSNKKGKNQIIFDPSLGVEMEGVERTS